MAQTTGDLFEGYRRGDRRQGQAWDEMFDVHGKPRPEYREILQALDQMTDAEFRERTDALASSYLAQGITFDFAGEEKPFPLDAVPRVISPQDWHYLESGVAQRVRVLEAFLADIYGPGRCIKDGVIPAALISSSAHYHRQAQGIESPNGVRVMVGGIDVIRDEKGLWRVLEDNVRVPSGVSYVISNRRVMGQTLPELFFKMSVRAVGDYPHKLLHALRASAPNGIDDPTVVVLTPGVYNSAYYEHTLLARLMGVELVEGRDLYCTGGRVMMHTTSGPRRVDVIYRRVDDDFLDPLQFRPDSVLGAPGLVEAARRGNVTLANAIGNGVADDKLVYTYMPDLMDYYLGEKPILPNVDTWRLEEPGALEEVFDRLHELCVKPVDGSGGKGLVMGPTATTEELDALRRRLRHDPRGWIAQPVVQLSTIPTLVEEGIRPRHADLRPFAVNDGEDVWVLPGGLTRVALPEGKLVVNSSQGGGSKDTWVLNRSATPEYEEALEPAVERIDVDAQEEAAERAEAEAERERAEAERDALGSTDEYAEADAESPRIPLEERPIVVHPQETSRLDSGEVEQNQQQKQQQQQAGPEVTGC
ncbi:circularly permuted type 2 ATP-grasp protein [Epidermidibacterium keratini]|uniref:Circularly permuted type 2 ATP-grasp protein n=1 Tax=Epidermidibacterium keratini TaxID=1891644 RepID=A0A7L4YJL9_9ACTN|nr:circularly permuted type 2 ATP-grasp protein [Epidermidibacterium keratini]QHB99291.1 circularly permuted type 2 ATP-grasp protein [Epidermidibacterium keratini]